MRECEIFFDELGIDEGCEGGGEISSYMGEVKDISPSLPIINQRLHSTTMR